jgi:hypothetical protein
MRERRFYGDECALLLCVIIDMKMLKLIQENKLSSRILIGRSEKIQFSRNENCLIGANFFHACRANPRERKKHPQQPSVSSLLSCMLAAKSSVLV